MITDAIEHAPINVGYYRPDEYLALSPDREGHPLAAIIHGQFRPPHRLWPQVHSGLRPLDEEAYVELIFTSQRPNCSSVNEFLVSSTEEILFASCNISETDGLTLSDIAEDLYSNLLQLVLNRGYPHLLRIWNLVPFINDQQDGLERYRQFCVGRHEAFEKCFPMKHERYPAASGVGPLQPGLRVYCLAATSPGITVENPNQVSAYRYPPQYGPRSPSFSRALVKKWKRTSCLFLSGTASITGHETRHVGQLAAQIEEALFNVTTLIGAATQISGENFVLGHQTSKLKAFIRRADDYPEVRNLLERHLGLSANMLLLEADLCRGDLLFEIEGVIQSPSPSL